MDLVLGAVILAVVSLLSGVGTWWRYRMIEQRRVAKLSRDFQDATQELLRLTAAAESANKAKADFLAVMSHELRTPLTAIIGYGEILTLEVHGPLTAKQLEDCNRIFHAGEHLLRLISQILDYAKLEACKHQLERRSTMFLLKLEAVREMVEPSYRTKNIELYVGCEAPSTWVLGDTDAIKQVLLNLLNNACKFTPARGRVTVRIRLVGGLLVAEVQDTGIGIPLDKQAMIFEPFTQVNPTTTREYGGAGLGLAISRQLCRAMGGDLTVTSNLGEGACFRMTLPRDHAMGVVPMQPDPTAAAPLADILHEPHAPH